MDLERADRRPFGRRAFLLGALGATTAGYMTFTRPASIGTYRTKVTRVVALNRAWDGVTPANAFLKKPAKKPKKKPARR